ncbi:hypothetical protein [Sulfolobus sp. E11-6]|uniref:hypothetical protein n=1 Tax=Sulfolobus sp. E11-6 TaxID=2663020 RepID=UPI001296E2B2|nr:hypothetical protein [Sulfolobus sp. E11-6]QGA69225.1 hypothetical protein GFS33_11415 [Sulfolobus sp. E11-6]
MNTKVWGPILSGGVLVAISIVLFTMYSFSLLKSNPVAFGTFSVSGLDIAGIALAIIGLALIMTGAFMQD